ncbi:MAG: SpoIIE family protein phosphatase [Ruminococcus sp.]|nr:SpoIIE family protein phosphatase [Ruminococcus sp.]
MELTVYRQASKTRPDGTVVYKGEDARPYVDSSLIMTADGLGGAAAIRHTKISPELFDENKVTELLFGGVMDDISDKAFQDYVKDSFFELRSVKDIYTDNVNNIKKSGYFASRIVSAIVLHNVLTENDLRPENLFTELEKQEKAGKREEFLKGLGEWFRKEIKEKLCKAAEKANIVYESAYAGLALLGTTLTAAIYRENKDSVDVLYVTAGDSRPYVWNKEDGLCQIIADQERADGGMTNYIRADEGSDFTIDCSAFSFKKPCVLFNSTDGCFDSGYFIHPMAFEKTLLETAGESKDPEEMSAKLTDFFLEYGRHDDSSTIAMKFFGYSDFADFKKAAAERLAFIEKNYLSELEGLLQHDYGAELDQLNADKEKRLAVLCGELAENEAVDRFCRESVDEYCHKAAKDQFDDAAAEIREKAEKARRNILREAQKHITGFVMADDSSDDDRRSAAGKVQTAGEHYRSSADSYLKQLRQQSDIVSETASQLSDMIARVSDAGIPESMKPFPDDELAELKSCEAAVASLFGFLGSLRSGKNPTVRSIVQKRTEYDSGNRKYAEKYPDDAERIAEALISGAIPLDKSAMDEDERQILETMLEIVRTQEEELGSLEEQLLKEAQDKYSAEYWKNNSLDIVKKIIAGDTSFPEDMTKAVKEAASASEEEAGELPAKAELQSQLFGEYDETYEKYMDL